MQSRIDMQIDPCPYYESPTQEIKPSSDTKANEAGKPTDGMGLTMDAQ